jgi:pyruvate dehydrogenase (quinone)
MAQMVADVLVGVLEQIGVRQIFGMIGDSLNPLATRFAGARWSGSAFGMRREQHSRLRGKLSLGKMPCWA